MASSPTLPISRITVAIIIIISVLIFTGIGSSIYFYQKYKSAASQVVGSSQEANLKEAKDLAKKVGKLIDVPTDEDPSVATINDVEKLKDQTFFAKAKNGDKLLVYSKAKKAILYDPTLNKIIEVGPVVIPTPTAPDQTEIQPTSSQNPLDSTLSPTAAPSPTPGPKISVAIYNGTNTSTAVNTVEMLITGKTKNVDIVSKKNAAARNYTKTLVIDLRGNMKDSAKTLATLLDGELALLPDGETKPANADFLVIVGASSAPAPTP